MCVCVGVCVCVCRCVCVNTMPNVFSIQRQKPKRPPSSVMSDSGSDHEKEVIHKVEHNTIV